MLDAWALALELSITMPLAPDPSRTLLERPVGKVLIFSEPMLGTRFSSTLPKSQSVVPFLNSVRGEYSPENKIIRLRAFVGVPVLMTREALNGTPYIVRV